MPRIDITFGNRISWYEIQRRLDFMFTEIYDALFPTLPKVKFTDIGGLAVLMTNKTGAATVKGNCVTTGGTANNSVVLVSIDVPNCVGVFLDSSVADGEEAYVVVSGIADVYYWGSTTSGYLARTGLTTDTGEISGQATSEEFPTSPFATDKHFCEIGHVLQSRVGAGLSRCVLHFN